MTTHVDHQMGVIYKPTTAIPNRATRRLLKKNKKLVTRNERK